MREQPYDSEDLLQKLLADHPALLAGEQIDRRAPRRWLLIRREAGVPSAQDASDRWSSDHLFLDQDGVPTIVEVKRSSDTRIRREVVGQMLDYAANAVVYWPLERIRSMFEAANPEADSAVCGLLLLAEGSADGVEAFWQTVDRNLKAGRVRMVFVADVIPEELQRIVEFLNEQMRPAEVLAVEVRQYVGESLRTLVPRVFGLTAEAVTQKGRTSSPAMVWDEERFLEQAADKSPNGLPVIRRLLQFAKSESEITYGTGKTSTFHFNVYSTDGLRTRVRPFVLYADGGVEIDFQNLGRALPPSSVLRYRELLRQVPSMPADLVNTETWKKFPVSILATEGAWAPFERAVRELKAMTIA